MRIAILTDDDFAKLNGLTTTLRALFVHAPLDVQPHVYALANEATREPGYTAFAAWGRPIPFHTEVRMYLPRLGAIRERLAADGAGAIHLTSPGPSGLAARSLAGSLRLPLIGSYHTEYGEYGMQSSGARSLGRCMQQYLRWLYDRCERVLVPSEATLEHLVACGWRREQLTVWTRGVDPSRFTPRRRARQLRSAWRVSDGCPVILYAGRLSREKGLGLLVDVGRLLDEYRIPHRFVICGDGPMLRQLQMSMREAVFTGTVDHASMGQIMASSDLLLFPSDTDTAGNVVLEAQASGLPVLVSDRGGAHENVIDRVTGFICHAGSERGFCCRAAELLVDGQKRQRMSASAREYALTRSWGEAMRPLLACYREVLRTGAARRPLTAEHSAPGRAAT